MSKVDLICGDCLEKMKDIPDKSIDMILCDLPYGTTACKWDIVIPFEPLWEQYNRIIKDNGAIVLFGSEPFSSYLRMSNIKNYKYDWYWEKNRASGFSYSHSQPMRLYEIISVFYKNKPYYDYKYKKLDKPYKHTLPIHKSKIYDTNFSNGDVDNRQYVIYEYSSKTNKLMFNKVEHPLHPTQKPVDLLEYLIKTYTNENEIVLDNCMGSGSTGVACKHLNRNFIGIELDKNYFEIAKKRIEGAKNE